MKRLIYVFLLGIPLVFYLKLYNSLGLSENTLNLVIFIAAALSLIPLASFVEGAVEELSELLGQFIGGLLHTTFGNIAELVLGITILIETAHHQITNGEEIVRASIAGSVIRNSLLFLGLATVLGVWRNGKMTFDAENASEYSTVFALAVIGLALPTVGPLISSDIFNTDVAFHVSIILSIVLLIIYLAYILFSVFRVSESAEMIALRREHRDELARLRANLATVGSLPLPASTDVHALFEEERERAEARLAAEASAAGSFVASTGVTQSTATSAAAPALPRKRIDPKGMRLEIKKQEREDRGEGNRGVFALHPIVRGLIAVAVLAAAAAGVVVMSEQFVGTIEPVAETFLGGNELFVGLIIIPVIGGVVEVTGAVGMARRNRMEITMAVTAGASIQMILLVAPVLVLVGASLGLEFNLVLQPLALATFLASSFVFMLLGRDGQSSLLEGVQLIAFWVLVASTAFFIKG